MLALSPLGARLRDQGARRHASGVDRPSATEFGRFAEAAGRRFPSVDLWTLWNEPNHPGFLFPQATQARECRTRRGSTARCCGPGSPGLKRSGHGGDRILFGELLPIGKRNALPQEHDAADPLPARALLPRLELARVPRARRAPARLQRLPQDHRRERLRLPPLHAAERARCAKEPTPDDATIRSYGRITRALDIARAQGPHRRRAAERVEHRVRLPVGPAGRLLRGQALAHPRLHVAIRVDRLPQPARGEPLPVPDDRHADLRAVATAASGRAACASPTGARSRACTPPTGCRCSCALLGPSAVEVWGAARPGGAGASVQIQSRAGQGRLLEPRARSPSRTCAATYTAPDQGLARAPSAVPRVPAEDKPSWATKAVSR